MIKKISKNVTQLVEQRFDTSVVPVTNKQRQSFQKKSEQSGYPLHIIEEVYARGYIESENESLTPEQNGFDRVNSFIANGRAVKLDEDLLTQSVLYELRKLARRYNVPLAKIIRKYKKNIGKDKFNLPGHDEHSSAVSRLKPYLSKAKRHFHFGEEINSDDPENRFIGTDSLTQIYKDETPGQSKAKTVKRVIKERLIHTGNKYKLVSKKTGRHLGTFDSKKDAIKRERQIQYFKHKGE